jgi:hypothetical protein
MVTVIYVKHDIKLTVCLIAHSSSMRDDQEGEFAMTLKILQ